MVCEILHFGVEAESEPFVVGGEGFGYWHGGGDADGCEPEIEGEVLKGGGVDCAISYLISPHRFVPHRLSRLGGRPLIPRCLKWRFPLRFEQSAEISPLVVSRLKKEFKF